MVIDMKIVIVGGSFEGLFLALNICQNHDVAIIELQPEIGIPNDRPALIHSEELLNELNIPMNHPMLQSNQTTYGITFRLEWLMKLLTIQCSQQNIAIFTRTRIIEHNYDHHHIIHVSSEQQEIVADVLIDARWPGRSFPGRKNHVLKNDKIDLVLIGQQFSTPWVGRTYPIQKGDFSQASIILPRADSLVETWWKKEMAPNDSLHIEQVQIVGPKNIADLSLDSNLPFVRDIITKLM